MSRRAPSSSSEGRGIPRGLGALMAAIMLVLGLSVGVACSSDGHGVDHSDGHADAAGHADTPAHAPADGHAAETHAPASSAHGDAASTHAPEKPGHANADHAETSAHAAPAPAEAAHAAPPAHDGTNAPAPGEQVTADVAADHAATEPEPAPATATPATTTAGAATPLDLPHVDATRNARAAKTAKAILDSSRKRSADAKSRQASAASTATEPAAGPPTSGAATPDSAPDSDWSSWLPWGDVSERERSSGTPLGFTEELTAEVRALREWLTLPVLLLLGALLALAWFATRVIRWVLRLLFRLGVERAPWVDNLGMVGRLAIWAWVLLMIVIRAWRIAPMITLLAVALVAAGLMVGLVKHFENLSTGIGLALRGRIKAGDQITVGEHTGMVRGVGLMHLNLRTPEGSTVYLPNRLLAGEAIQIGRARNSYPLRARLTAPRAWPPQALETARCVASLSPYRDVNSRISVGTEGKDGRALVVEIQVWSPRLLDAADKHLRAMLEEHLRALADGP